MISGGWKKIAQAMTYQPFASRQASKTAMVLCGKNVTFFNCPALNCGLSSKVSITLGNFLNLFVSSKLNKNRQWSQGGEKDSTSYRLSAGCVKASKTAMVTLPFKMFCPFWSVWCKMALAEVGMSLPWWCHAVVLLAPGYWSLSLNLIIFS